jgi:tetratricopeptide (TPR) repeat protein
VDRAVRAAGRRDRDRTVELQEEALMGWVMLLLIALTTAALLAVLRLPRLLWPLGGAMIMLGAAGYAWQGEPDLQAQPVMADAVKLPPSKAYKDLRDTFFGRFGGESMYFGISDAALTNGDPDFAARALTGGVDYAPQNAALWNELGNIIALHDRGIVSPASLLAYRRAMQLAPENPGPPLFLGLAYVRAGEYAKARPLWLHALALTPKDASYRGEITKRLALLDMLFAELAREQAAAAKQ